MSFVYPPTPVTQRTRAVEVECGPQRHFIFNNATPYHMFISAGRAKDPFVPDEVILPWNAKTTQLNLDNDQLWISYLADTRYGFSDSANAQAADPYFSFVGDITPMTTAPASMEQAAGQLTPNKFYNFAYAITANTYTPIWHPPANKKFRVMRVIVWLATTSTYMFLADGTNNLAGGGGQGGGAQTVFDFGNLGVISSTPGQQLNLYVGVSQAVYGVAMGTEV